MKLTITTFCLFFIVLMSFGQAPNGFKYQAVARDATGIAIPNSTVDFRISIIQGSTSGTPVCVEVFNTTTNNFGIVNLEVGTINQTDFSAIDWSAGPYFIKVEMYPSGGSGYLDMGTTQLVSVPYAMYAKTAETITGGVTESDPIFVVSPANGITNTDITNWNNKLDSEVDGSVTNELQALSISNDTIYLSNGGFVKLPAGFDGQYSSLTGAPTNVSSLTNDAGYLTSEVDGSVINELQALSISNDTIYLSNGGFVKLPAGFDGQYSSLTGAPTNVSSFANDAGYLTSEVDGSVTNELQALSISNDTIYLSNGGFVKLPAGFDGQYSSLTGVPTNVSSFTNDAGYLTSEVDGSVTNELQALSISNDTIYLSNGGFVKLPASNAWLLNGNAGTNPAANYIGTNDANDFVLKTNNTEKMRISSTGKVGIGTAGTTFPLEVSVPSTNGSQFNLKLTNLTLGIGNGVGILFAPDDAAIAKMGIFVERKASWGFGTMHFLSRLTSDYASADLSNSVMSLTQDGNLGIGMTAPTVPLSVKRSTYGTGLSVHLGMENNDAILLQNTNLVSTINGINETFNIANNGTNVITINNNNVGIGTVSPAVKLDVKGNAKFGATSMINIWEWDAIEKIGLDYNTANGDFNMRNPVAGKRLLATITATGSWGIETTAGNEMVRVTGSGNMGIGTTNPGSILQLEKSGSSTGPVLTLSNPSAQATATDSPISAIDFKGWASATQPIQFRIQAIDDGNYSNHLAFMSKGQSSGGALTEKMRISSTGNVGIGTTTPNARLDLGSGYGVSGEKFLLYNDNTSGPLAGTKTGFYLDRFSLQNNVTFVFPTAPAFPGSYMIARKNTAGTILEPLMTVLGESGNVGIGTTAPAAKLDVVGDLKVSGSIYAPGTVVQTIVQTSDVTSILNTTTFTEADPTYRISITPKFANSIFLIEYSFSINTAFANNTIFRMQLIRDIGGTEVPVGTGPVNGIRNQSTFTGRTQGFDANDNETIYMVAKDQNLTVGTTYTYGFKYQRESGGAGTCYFNYSMGDSNIYGFSGIMTMKITEIAQ